jgi:hypothetical protein
MARQAELYSQIRRSAITIAAASRYSTLTPAPWIIWRRCSAQTVPRGNAANYE